MRVGNGCNNAIKHIVQTTNTIDMHQTAVVTIKIDNRGGGFVIDIQTMTNGFRRVVGATFGFRTAGNALDQ